MDDIERPKETSEERAKRMWSNHDLTRRLLEEKHKPAPVVKINPDMAEIISTERLKADETTRFERKFIKDLRAMLEGHKQRSVEQYRRALLARIYRLKLEKVRRLEAQRNQEAQHAQF